MAKTDLVNSVRGGCEVGGASGHDGGDEEGNRAPLEKSKVVAYDVRDVHLLR